MHFLNNQGIYLVPRVNLAGTGSRRRPVLGSAWGAAVHDYLDAGPVQLRFGSRSGHRQVRRVGSRED